MRSIQVLINRRIHTENVVYIPNKIYSATKKNEILSFAAKWMGLEGLVLIKIGQTENKKYCLFSFTCGSENIT
jgi:hypothetical protein